MSNSCSFFLKIEEIATELIRLNYGLNSYAFPNEGHATGNAVRYLRFPWKFHKNCLHVRQYYYNGKQFKKIWACNVHFLTPKEIISLWRFEPHGIIIRQLYSVTRSRFRVNPTKRYTTGRVYNGRRFNDGDISTRTRTPRGIFWKLSFLSLLWNGAKTLYITSDAGSCGDYHYVPVSEYT